MKKIKAVIAALAVCTALSATTKDEQALYDLVSRIAPQHQNNFIGLLSRTASSAS